MAGETPRGEVCQPLHVGVDTCTPGVGGGVRVVRGTRVHGYTWKRSCSCRGYAAEDRCLEKTEGCVSALHMVWTGSTPGAAGPNVPNGVTGSVRVSTGPGCEVRSTGW